MKIELQTIGVVHSPFKEKFGVPRQPGLVPDIEASLELLPPFNRTETVDGLEGYSHIWIQFLFDRVKPGRWQPKVRPPRLGGNHRVGVFASRSPFRPNPIGLSVVKLVRIDTSSNGVTLVIAGIDLVDGTPVLDIKPYVPYVDAVVSARGGFASAPPDKYLHVSFSEIAEQQLEQRSDGARLRVQIQRLLALDPRPAYQKREQSSRVYGMRLYDFDLRWKVLGRGLQVLSLENIAP